MRSISLDFLSENGNGEYLSSLRILNLVKCMIDERVPSFSHDVVWLSKIQTITSCKDHSVEMFCHLYDLDVMLSCFLIVLVLILCFLNWNMLGHCQCSVDGIHSGGD